MRIHLALVLCSALLRAQDPTPPKPVDKPATPPAATTPAELDEKAFAALHELAKTKPPAPTGETVKIGGDQHYLALPKTGKAPFPAVLVIHEWWGLNDHVKHYADRIAAEGYAALAVDLYHGAVATTPED